MSVSVVDRFVFGPFGAAGHFVYFISRLSSILHSSLSLSLFLSFSFSTHSFLLSSLDLLSFIPLVDCILPLSFVVVVQSFAITVLS